MTANQLAEWIGAQGSIKALGLTIPVVVLDARVTFGRLQFQVAPSFTLQLERAANSTWVDRATFTGRIAAAERRAAANV